MRAMILDEGVRADGRKPTEVRPIWCEVGVIPRAHGSAVFTRGQTQILSVATLAGPAMKQELDGVDPQTEKTYMHKYIFPGFSVGEVKPLRGPGRREVGHGNLAERANVPALPSQDEFGYTIRVTSDVLESNGSTSMGSTCGSSMALMNAGVPVKCMIGGVAMGMIKEEGYEPVVLTDIQGIEDFLGDMDFKVTGNDDGITADLDANTLYYFVIEQGGNTGSYTLNIGSQKPTTNISSFLLASISTYLFAYSIEKNYDGTFWDYQIAATNESTYSENEDGEKVYSHTVLIRDSKSKINYRIFLVRFICSK